MDRCIRIFVFVVLLLSFLIPSGPARAEGISAIDIPLTALNSDLPIQLSGLLSTQNLDFTLPNNWKITDQSWLYIAATASDLLDQSDSSLTISLNGLQLKSFHFKELAGSGIQINIPGSFFISGKNVLSLDGMMYLPDDLKTNCKGWDDPARWMYLNPQSSLHIDFEKQYLPADLSNFPDSFLQPLDQYLPDGGDKTLFVLPDQIRSDDLNALSAAAYFLGYQAGSKYLWNPQVLKKSQFDQLNGINSNIVFIDNVPAQFENAIVTKKNAIGVFASPWDPSKTVMVIFDKDREDGYTPAIILGDWIRKILLSGNVAYFNKTAEKQPPAFKNKYSFEELGYLDRTVRGIGKENLIYRIFIPYNVDPTSADLSLDLTHGPDLDENTSSIAIVLNGYTVASVLPATQSARLEPIQIGLPTKRLRPGINFLRVSFDLHVQHSSCEKAPDSVWATVFNSSTFRLTYQNRSSVPTLNDFPSPFNEYPGATFVVPNQLDVNTLSHVAGLTFTIGAASYYPDQPPKIMTTEKYAKMSSKQGNYILVGLPTENTAIQDVNGYLPQPFKTNANQLQDGYGVFLPTFDSEASTGLMQIINSPWNDNGTVLVLAGTNTQGLDWVWNTILDPKMQGQFSGNLMIVGPKSGITAGSDVPASGSLLFKQTPMVINIPWIGKYLQQQGQSEEAVSIMAIALAGLFTLLALKIAPIISRLEIRFKNHSDNSDKERE